eukprot:5518291-Pyramimonas_sp.AAC.1
MGDSGSNWGRRRLAASLRSIIIAGSTKDARVPFLTGTTKIGGIHCSGPVRRAIWTQSRMSPSCYH